MKHSFKMAAATTAALMALSACQQQVQQLKSGITLDNLDTLIPPGQDFYQYATGGWQKSHPLTAEYSRYGSFDLLQENNNIQLRQLIDSIAKQTNAAGSIEDKIAKLYNSAMDSARLEEKAMADLKAFLSCDGYQHTPQLTKTWLQKVWPRMMRQGVSGAFNFYITADEKNATQNILYITQGGLTLGQKDYYIDQDPETAKIRSAYSQYIVKLSQRMGFSEQDAKRICQDVMRIETFLAQESKSMTELRNPHDNYNKLSYAQLKQQYAKIDWDTFFHNFGITEIHEVVIGQPKAIHAAEKVMSRESPEALQNYYLWHAMNMASSYLDDATRAINFDFWGRTLSGKQEERPRWKRAVSSVESGLGEALGQLYVARYFPPAAKKRMEQMIKHLQQALGERIDVQDWMSEKTKKVAHEKLEAFYVKVGYPNKWKDYSSLEIGDSYLNNMLACNEWSIQEDIQRHMNKPVDPNEWLMTPQTVNAYYNPTTNEICFPAGILQPPFFDMEADDAFNYGAIGVVIGHEMTHGFDDQGSQYDKEGNLRQWWNQEDCKRFEERIQGMRAFYDNIEVLPGLKANGSLTLGENLADHGGLMVAFQAFSNVVGQQRQEKKDGFTAQQRFFLAYANVWGQNIRKEEIRKCVKSDPHSLGKWRVNGQLPHLDAWYEAFDISDKDAMFIPKNKRINIW